MNEYLLMSIIVVLFPAMVVATCMFWVIAFDGLERLSRLFEVKTPPYCDIDPRNHPCFVVDKEGDGWIAGCRVIHI